MRPLTLVYWLRALLGVSIGFLCAFYVYSSVTSELVSLYTLLTGLSFAMLFYIATYYIIKLRFFTKVEKPSKLSRQGIGVYFFAWIVAWTLMVTLLLPSATVNIYYSDSKALVDDRNLWVVARNEENPEWMQNVTTSTGSLTISLLPPGTYRFELGDVTGYNVTGQSQVFSIAWLQALKVEFNITAAS